MKRYIIYAIIAGAAAAALQGCIEDSRENFMVDDSISIVYDNQVVGVSVYAGSQTVSVLKSGKGTVGAYAEIGQSSDALAAYNADEVNDLKYTQINSSLISFSTSRVDFQAKDVRQSFEVSWNPDDVVATLTGDSQVVPVSVLGSDIKINESRSFILLNILNSTAEFASSGATVTARESASEDGEVQIKIKLDHPLPKDITVEYSVDNTLAEAYNAEKNTSYTLAPAGYVSGGKAVIKAGATDVFTTLTLKTSALFEGTTMMNFRTFVIPLVISGTDIKGVKVSDKVYYLLVNSPYSGPSFSRIWGFDSQNTLWSLAFGIPSGADRNLAIDDEWVYLPYAIGKGAGGKAEITAISINDPETTKKVNCTGMEDATIISACVRVIDKGDGTTMLVASGAGEGNFPFYVWENGIDNPPTVYDLECTWRRGGDRFEFHGTWAKGTLYVHAYQGRFATRYKVVGGQFETTSRTLVDMKAGDTGFGGFYPYPGQDQMVFTTSDASAFITMLDTYNDPGDGQKAWETAREEFPGADMTWGYRCFTLRGDKYIAYTAVDKDDDVKEDGVTTYTTKQRARLVVVKDKGGFKASLLGDNKDIVFEAPIQGEEFTSFAIAPPASTQGDCAIKVYSDKVIIAAGVQGLGIVVYKME